MTTDHTYKIVELVGSSQEGLQQVIDNAITRAAQTLHNLDWFEVKEIRGTVGDGKVGSYQIKPESTEGRPWGQSLKKPEGAPLNLG